jgi:TolB-like protein/cytochrome c-type biogenesis protein CcmH/NrfG
MAEIGEPEKTDSSAPSATATGTISPVFISYASQDVAVANVVCTTLEAAGFPCWIAPRDVRAGEPYAAAIVAAINACRLLVLVLTKSAIDSPHVLREIERASSKKRPVLSIRMDASQLPPELEYFLSANHWLDASGGAVESVLPALIDSVRVRKASLPTRLALDTNTPGIHAAPDPLHSAALRRTPPRWGARSMAVALAVAAVGLAYVLADKFWLSKRAVTAAVSTAAAPAATTTAKSVAVLPFADLSEKKDQEYFSDGLSEELIDLLGKIPELRVPARTSSFYFKGKQATLGEIAKALSVSHILEGSVRKSGNQLRITAELVRTDTDTRIWSETFDRKLDDIFKVQDEISAAVVKALKISLLEGAAPKATPAANTEAYTLFLQGRALAQRHTRADNAKAGDYLRQSLKADPNFTPAWVLLARVRADDWNVFGTIDYKQARAEVSDAATHALKLAPSSPDARIAMSHVLFDVNWDWDGAEREINKALELDPSNAEALEQAAFLAMTRGQCERALQFAQSAAERDPLDVDRYRGLGIANICGNRLAQAEASFRKALELNATSEGLHYKLGLVLLMRGESRAALAEMEHETQEEWRNVGLPLVLDALGRKSEADQALSVVAKHPESWEYQLAQIYARRSDMEHAFASLEQAFQERDGGLATYVKWDPLLNNVRSDPRYQALLRKMKLAD